MKPILFALNLAFVATLHAGNLDLSWSTIDCGGALMTGGTFVVSASVGQPDAGAMSGGTFGVVGGFWAGGAAGVPAATITTAVSRRTNPHAPTFCDSSLLPPRKSEPHSGGVQQVRIGFDVTPGTPGESGVTLEQATCAAPSFVLYSGASVISSLVAGNELVVTLTPGLENSRTYRLNFGSDVTSVSGQSVVVRGLVGDTDGNGFVNATDRSQVVGGWTGAGGFTCSTDVNSSGATNATDRSLVVGAWTGGQNCAP